MPLSHTLPKTYDSAAVSDRNAFIASLPLGTKVEYDFHDGRPNVIGVIKNKMGYKVIDSNGHCKDYSGYWNGQAFGTTITVIEDPPAPAPQTAKPPTIRSKKGDTVNIEIAMDLIRSKTPGVSQRKLAKGIYCAPYTYDIDRLRTLQSVYHTVRRIDRNKKAAALQTVRV